MTSSNSPEAEADVVGSSAATPYGTRSRGRNAPRPNYAEDRDIDMDFDAAPTKTAKRNSSVALNPLVNGSKPVSENESPAPPRSSLTNGTGSHAASKDTIPGTSSFSARPDDVNGSGSLRKRKHAASTPNSNSNPGGNAAKKHFTLPPGDLDGDGRQFTNMLSFESSPPLLKDGQIKADDGTTLAVNGSS